MQELERLKTTSAELTRLCDEFAVAELSVFGSILRDELRYGARLFRQLFVAPIRARRRNAANS